MNLRQKASVYYLRGFNLYLYSVYILHKTNPSCLTLWVCFLYLEVKANYSFYIFKIYYFETFTFKHVKI